MSTENKFAKKVHAEEKKQEKGKYKDRIYIKQYRMHSV